MGGEGAVAHVVVVRGTLSHLLYLLFPPWFYCFHRFLRVFQVLVAVFNQLICHSRRFASDLVLVHHAMHGTLPNPARMLAALGFEVEDREASKENKDVAMATVHF